jgi:hypothetical protein
VLDTTVARGASVLNRLSIPSIAFASLKCGHQSRCSFTFACLLASHCYSLARQVRAPTRIKRHATRKHIQQREEAFKGAQANTALCWQFWCATGKLSWSALQRLWTVFVPVMIDIEFIVCCITSMQCTLILTAHANTVKGHVCIRVQKHLKTGQYVLLYKRQLDKCDRCSHV